MLAQVNKHAKGLLSTYFLYKKTSHEQLLSAKQPIINDLHSEMVSLQLAAFGILHALKESKQHRAMEPSLMAIKKTKRKFISMQYFLPQPNIQTCLCCATTPLFPLHSNIQTCLH
jgi:hypothetical protein